MYKKLTQEDLKKLLNYNPCTGIFKWKVDRSPMHAGHIAGTINNDGYIQIKILGKTYLAHRLVFLYMDGYWPENDIDHKYGIKDDNRWKELREVSKTCNAINRKISCINTSGVTGVILEYDKWKAQITINKKQLRLGTFKNFDLAVKTRWNAEVKYDFPNCNTTSTAYNYLKENKLLMEEV